MQIFPAGRCRRDPDPDRPNLPDREGREKTRSSNLRAIQVHLWSRSLEDGCSFLASWLPLNPFRSFLK
jgi:hypothetical protein